MYCSAEAILHHDFCQCAMNAVMFTLFGVLAVTDIMPPRFLVTNSDNNTKRRFSIPSMCSSRAAMLDILDRLVLTYKT